ALPSLSMKDMRDFPGVRAGFMGHKNISAWTLKNETLVFTSIMPLSEGRVILFAHHARGLAEDLSRFQQDIFRIFISIMTLSIAFSLYLVGTITNPLRKLAKAAETINNDTNKLRHNIPDMSDRGDEIGELSIALSSMVETLWARMGTIEAFAADVSHELKNPITSIKSALETLPKIKNKDDKEQLLKILSFDVERLDRLITDISKSTRLDVELSQGPTDIIYLDEFLRDTLKIYETHPICQEKDIHIDFVNRARHGLCIFGNRDKLVQVIVNIIDNALSFSSEHQRISVVVENDDAHVTVSISDMGAGIPDSKLDKIFERFYSNRPKKEGQEHHSGLGLSIVRQIVRAHDGRIIAENMKDEDGNVSGASFKITLPSYEQV
ncbi:MAG: ATP-binding protein, partial [Bdellovibrionales bacterium]